MKAMQWTILLVFSVFFMAAKVPFSPLLCRAEVESVAGRLGPHLAMFPSTAEVSFPSFSSDHPASSQFSAWLSAFNTANEETLLAYHTDARFPYSTRRNSDGHGLDNELRFARMTGGFNLVEVESSEEPSSVVVVLKDKKRSIYARASMTVNVSRPSYPVTSFDIRAIITPIELIPKDDPRRPQYERALAPLTAERRRAILNGVSEVLREEYIYPEMSENIIAALAEHLSNGEYDAFEKNEKFAERLTKDIQAAGHEKRMGVGFFEPFHFRNDNWEGHDGKPESHLEALREFYFGFESISFDTDSFPGRTIATLPIKAFVRSEERFASDWQEIRAAIGEVLSSVADADALVVDLRSNFGGSPSTISFMLSYLLDEGPVHLLDFVNRTGGVEASYSTLHADQLPPGTKRFGGTKPLFVLTSNKTAPGGEDMAYGLQAFKRAKAIIGEGNEATAGAANTGHKPRFVAEQIFGKGWWFVSLPSLRPVQAITGSNWEGTGVKSDIIAGKGDWHGENDANEVARTLAIRALESDTPVSNIIYRAVVGFTLRMSSCGVPF